MKKHINKIALTADMSSTEQVKQFLQEIKPENIQFKHHFFERIQERPISEEMVRKYLKQTDRLLKVEEQPARLE